MSVNQQNLKNRVSLTIWRDLVEFVHMLAPSGEYIIVW